MVASTHQLPAQLFHGRLKTGRLVPEHENVLCQPARRAGLGCLEGFGEKVTLGLEIENMRLQVLGLRCDTERVSEKPLLDITWGSARRTERIEVDSMVSAGCGLIFHGDCRL